MSSKSIGSSILSWVEIVLSARILLFTIPVLMNKQSNENINLLKLQKVDDWFIFILTILSLCFLTIGVGALLGNKLTKIFHVIVVICAGIMTFAFYRLTVDQQVPFLSIYVAPILVCIILAVLASIFHGKLSAGKR